MPEHSERRERDGKERERRWGSRGRDVYATGLYAAVFKPDRLVRREANRSLEGSHVMRLMC